MSEKEGSYTRGLFSTARQAVGNLKSHLAGVKGHGKSLHKAESAERLLRQAEDLFKGHTLEEEEPKGGGGCGHALIRMAHRSGDDLHLMCISCGLKWDQKGTIASLFEVRD